MEYKKIFRGRALYAEENRIWVARGMSFWSIDYNGNRLTKKITLGSIKQRILSCNRLSRQLLREGIHHLLPLINGDFFVTAKRQSFIISESGEIKNIFKNYKGNKPGHQGVCLTPDGTIFFGEYTLNSKRENSTKLFRSLDNGMNFECVLEFSKDEVRHIHFVKYDPFEKCLWLGTGDENFECKLSCSKDNGTTWNVIGEGSQNWRAIGICLTKDNLIWGTDAGSVPDKNSIIRMNRKDNKIEIIANAEGPCHGCAGFSNGQIFISTGVEGGENEQDSYARLKKVSETKVVDILKMKKDFLPLILQYGVIRFPLGTENTDKIIFTTMGLLHGGEKIYKIKL